MTRRPARSLLLAAVGLAGAARAGRAEPARWRLDAEVVGSGRLVARADDTYQELRLDRAELGATAYLGPATAPDQLDAVLRLEAVRSAGPDSTFGVDGDALLLRVRQAEVRGRRQLGRIALEARGGLLAEPWTAWLGVEQPLRPVAPSASEGELRWEPSDIGGALGATRGPLALDVAVTTGEGRRYPERNRGVTTTALLAATFGHVAGARPAVRLALVGRDGSIGPGAARDQRAGIAATARARQWSAGAEVVAARGLADDGALTGTAWAAWASAALPAHLQLGARAAGLELTSGDHHRTAVLALGVAPPAMAGAAVTVFVAAQHDAYRGAPWPGADAVDQSAVLLILAADTRRGPP